MQSSCSVNLNRHPILVLKRLLERNQGAVWMRISCGASNLVAKKIDQGFSFHDFFHSYALASDYRLRDRQNLHPLLLVMLQLYQAHAGEKCFRIGHNEIYVQLLGHTHLGAGFQPGAARPDVQSVFHQIGLRFESISSPQWKDTPADGSITLLPKLLKGRNVFFLGSSRTIVFSRVLADTPVEHVCVPEYFCSQAISYSCDKLQDAMLRSTYVPVLIYTAASLGHLVVLELSRRGVEFIGFDIGLVATIFDHEYIATRPWFGDNGLNILRSSYALMANKQFLASRSMANISLESDRSFSALNEIDSFSRCWRSSIQMLSKDSYYSIGCLSGFLRDARYYSYPVAKSALLIWRYWYQGVIDEQLLLQCSSEVDCYISRLAAAAVCALRGQRGIEMAWQLLNSVKRQCPVDPRLELWDAALRSENCTSKVGWADALKMPGRSDIGSRLTWSNWGDRPDESPLTVV